MNLPANLQNYLCELVENKKQKNADFVNLKEYKKHFMNEQKSSGDSFGGGFGQGVKSKDVNPKDGKDILKIGLGDTDWKMPAAALGVGVAASGVDMLLRQFGGSVAGWRPDSFVKNLGKGLGLAGIDLGRNFLGQIQSLSGLDWAKTYADKFGEGTNIAYSTSMGGTPATGKYVPGSRQYGPIRPTPNKQDRDRDDLRQRIQDEEMRRRARRLGIS